MQEPDWRYYTTSAGGEVVIREIRSELGKDVNLAVKLEGLQERISTGQTLSRDVTPLGGGLYEARLSVQHNEWRLFYARREEGLVLLALHFASKKARKIPKAIAKARKRLAEWDDRM